MKGFSWCGNTFKGGYYMLVLLWFLAYNMLLYFDIVFNGYFCISTRIFSRVSLFVLYIGVIAILLILNISKRFVIVYLSPDVDTITKSQFMDEVNTGKVRYIADTHSVKFMRTKLLFLNKEEYLIVRRRIAMFESSKVRRGIQRARLCGFNW